MSDMISLKDRTAIVGIGETAFGKAMVQSEEQLACIAIKARSTTPASRRRRSTASARSIWRTSSSTTSRVISA